MGSSKADPSVYEQPADQPEVHQAAEFELQAQQFQYQQVVVEATDNGGNNASNYDQNQQPQNDPQAQGGQQQVLFQQQQPPQSQPIRYTLPPQPNLYQAQQPRPVQFPPPQSPQSPINPNGLNQPQPQFQAQQSPQFQAQQGPQFQAQQTYQPPQMNQPRPVQLSPQIQKMQTNPMYANGPNNQPAMGAQQSPLHQNGIGVGQNYMQGSQNYPAQGVPLQTHNYQLGGPNNINNMQIGNGGWTTGLFDCMDDPMNALITAFIPCLTFGQIAEIVDNGTTSCATSGFLYGLIGGLIGLPCIMSCTYRTKLRSRYGLMESPAPDWVTHLLCEWCALCQEYRELQHRGLDPSIGWLGNAQRNQQQANMMVPPINQNMMA